MTKTRLSVVALLIVVHQAVALAQQGVPALKVIAPNGAVSLLIGSLHIAADGLRQPADSIMDGAKTYVIEGAAEPGVPSPLLAPAEEVVLGLSSRAAWAQALSDEQVGQLVRHLDCTTSGDITKARFAVAKLLTLKRAAMAAEVASWQCASPGLLSRDALLGRAAEARGLPRGLLESQATANRQRAAVPESIYQASLYKAFTPDSREALQRVVVALNMGNYADIIQTLRDRAPSAAEADLYLKLLVTDRNHAWMPALAKYLDGGNAVVNVGGAHLPGPDGLIALLRQRGYQVLPTVVPASDSR